MLPPGTQMEAAPKSENYDSFLRIGGLALVALVLIVCVWGSLAKIQGAVIAPGTLVVESKPKVIQHLDGGIVGEIFVKDGDVVESGQVLMRLDKTMLEANRELVETRYYETLSRVSRLAAERDGADEIIWPDELSGANDDPVVAAAMRGQEKLFFTRKATAIGTAQQLNQRIEQSRNQISGLYSIVVSQQDQLDSLKAELSELQRGVDLGVVSLNRFNSMNREKYRLEGEIQRNGTEISRLRNVISETEVTKLQAQRDLDESILTELRSAKTEASDFREQLTSASDQRNRIDVKSPSDGIVHSLAVTTIGGVITPGQEIMQIIPQDDRLIIEAQVQPQDIDQIYEGQPATIRFSAFNQRRTPELNGFVLKSSADSLVDQVTGFPYYSVKLEVPQDEIDQLQGLQLLPGMPAEAFMQTESRSVLSYLVKPATDAMRRSLREE